MFLIRSPMKITRAVFAGSSTTVEGKPGKKLPEFAFIGRSNVGKSSLINALCGVSSLALTSSKPGKTRVVNHFEINGSWYLVDLPGYGYAKASGKEREAIENVIRNYLNFSKELKVLFVLIDSRHPLVATDASFLREMGGSDIPFAIIFTKADKSGPVACAQKVEGLKKEIREILGDGGMPECFISSAVKKQGKEEILNYIEQYA